MTSPLTISYIILITLPFINLEYIPPGPAFQCPKETDKLYPCVCEKGTDLGLLVTCENTNLAAMSVGVGNVAGLGIPIEKLTLKELEIYRLFGPLFHRSIIRVLHIQDVPIISIEPDAFIGVNRSLQEIYLVNTKLKEFPKEAFKILGNLTTLYIDGHEIVKLEKDIFSGSEAAARIERLHVVNGFIGDVAPDAFQYLKKLKKLDLHGNKLSTLKRNQFKGLREAEVLDISYNNITKLDGSHIGDMTKLGWCNASHNSLGEIPRGMFARNTVIKVVHLDNNRIRKLDTNSFRGMRFLRRLYLQDNQISDVGRGTFSTISRIGTINLARNNITKVDFQMFQNCKYAEEINLAENQITLIENQAFTDMYQAVVNISHNILETIEPNSFVNCLNLTLLDLSFNKLKEISTNAFDFHTYAGELQLSYNNFTDLSQIPIQNMTGIRVLNASHNQIVVIPRNTFPKLYELHTVDVSNNHLRDIFNAVFQNLFSLRYLNLSHNELEVIKPGTFGTIHTLLELDLSRNRLRDVSRGSLAKLASCRMIDISHNYLDKIFQIPISLGELNFGHNALQEIRTNTWPSMNGLLRLNLTNNQLGDNLRSDSFSGLLTLQQLDLEGNGLSRPPWEALSSFTSLQYLYLQNNNLTELSKSSFGNLPTLFHLDLSRNMIQNVTKLAFFGLQQLLYLSLRENQLYRIPNEAFKSLVALRNLDLSHNMLEKIDNKTNGLLEDCLSLESVNLSHNKFAFFTKNMFPSNPYIPYKLYEIDMSHNDIPVVTYQLTHGTKKLRTLNLAHNTINDIRNNVLGNLTSLEVLDLSGNRLDDLVSRNSETTFNLPENISEIYVRDNRIQTLPVDKLMNATKLKILDLRNNLLTSFEPQFVNKMISNHLDVYFKGNQLKCDCLVRPLKHYLNHLKPSELDNDFKYKDLTCAEPESLAGENIITVDEERLICTGNTELYETVGASNTKDSFNFITEPDLAFRDVQYSQSSIYGHWFVLTNQDVADFYVFIRNSSNHIFFNAEIPYNLRSITIPIEDNLKTAIQTKDNLEICLQAKNSLNSARKWFPNQCQKLATDYGSWPVKLSVDKRRLTKKKVRYSWFSSNVLGLVSDSILITLCIFIGVCLRSVSFDV